MVLTHSGTTNRRNAAWVLDRDAAGVWSHLSPIPGHPLEADLEWTPGGRVPAFSVTAADVDGDGRDELVFSKGEANGIWVLDYDPDDRSWRHLGPVVPPAAGRDIVLAAYQALLLHAGTSYAQLRQARSAAAADRRSLADRLGMSIDGGRPDAWMSC
ncbi:hypothetical protein [Arthrobacter sp. ISL-5]|uniref:hypothetical protein n=1 Tax=Arthrobacter sp. ISL-5 TaxID=2819111 RepID=UPI001BE4FE63|nr:hypothetical protein [Arthrobacter sp. ISL-5]MBT2555506.1 hypothetical protein [Arthrobacter sp. ISL-5]